MNRIRLIQTLVGIAAVGIASLSAAAPCPSNVVCSGGQPCESMTTVSGGQESIGNGGVWAHVDYDWGAATCRAITQLPFWSPVSLTGNVEANEDFVVTGLAPGTPLTMHARIRVVAQIQAPGGTPSNHAAGWLEEAGAGRVETGIGSEIAGPPINLDQVLALDFPNLAGETFRLTMGARSDSRDGNARATVTLSFVDLPPGAALSTCHSAGPVPARPVSWGNLKSQYR